MSKFILLLTSVFVVALPSCLQPRDIPPPKFHPNPPYPPTPVPPDGDPGGGVTDPPDIGINPSPIPTDTYPTAKVTENPTEVISPYPPYNVIDISGPPAFKSGQLARDPSNQKIFRVP